MNLSFCLPNIPFPNMENTFDKNMIFDQDISVIENRPEAPWIIRNQSGVIFTDNIQNQEEVQIQNLNDLIRASKLENLTI